MRSRLRRIRPPFLAVSLACLALLAAGDGTFARQIPFAAGISISSTLQSPQEMALGDIDGDGKLDVVTASLADDTLAWYETGNNGATWSFHAIDTAADAAHSVALADVDGDGDLDVFASQLNDVLVAWHENLGQGTSWAEHSIASVFQARSVTAVDIDRDGDPDALVATMPDDQVAWYENNGAGGGWTPHSITTTADEATAAFATDVDGDGDVDVLSASQGDDTIRWYENTNGIGTSWTAHTIDSTADFAKDVIAADIDGDGDLDAASASYLDDTVAWYQNTAGTFTTHLVSTVAGGADSVAAGDLDADGDLDLAAIASLDGELVWFENLDGVGGSWTERLVSAVVPVDLEVEIGDLDSDGDLDLAAVSSSGDEVVWFRNESIHRTVRFAAGQPLTTGADFPEAVVAADVDGDGDLDTMSVSINDGEVAWQENVGGAGAVWTSHAIATTSVPFSIEPADVDGDGDVDAVVAALGSDRVEWYANTSGDGTTWSTRTISTTVDGARSVFPVDLDRDGDIDVVSAARDGDAIYWHENANGIGTAWTQYTIDADAPGAISVAAGDFNSDGTVDVVSASLDDDTISLHLNISAARAADGNPGIFWETHVVSATALGASALAVADVDDDGDPDLAVASRDDNRIAWYENSALGDVWTLHSVSTSTLFAFGVGVADIDGDGDVDLLSASSNDDRIVWQENADRTGTTWLEHTISSAADGAVWTRAADLDGDGDLDVVSTSTADDEVVWYRNDGGQFALSTATSAPALMYVGRVDDALSVSVTNGGISFANDHSAELATLRLGFDDGTGAVGSTMLTTAQLGALVDSVRVYRDDGGGSFDEDDALVLTIPSPTLTAGFLTATLPDGEPNAAVGVGAPVRFWVALEPTDFADLQTPAQMRVIHDPAGGTSVEDRENDLPLAGEPFVQVASSAFGFQAQTNLFVDLSGSGDTATPGGAMNYLVNFVNGGPRDVDDATVTDVLPGTLACTWTCSGSDGTCAPNGVGSIAGTVGLSSGGHVAFSLSCTIDPSATGTLSYTASIAAPAAVQDLAPGDNSGTKVVTLEPSADLSITNSDGAASEVPGTAVTYTISVTSAGPSDAVNATVTDNFPGAVTGVNWTCAGANGGICPANGSGNISALVTLPAAGASSVTFTATGQIGAGATGSLVNSASVAAPVGTSDADPLDNAATDTDTLAPAANLAITKSDGVAVAEPNGTLIYAIVASNPGPSDAPGSVVADGFPVSLDCAWTCSGANGGSCADSGAGDILDTANLPAGGSATYTATCAVAATPGPTIANTATVATAAGVAELDAGDNSATDTDAVTTIFSDGFESGTTSAWSDHLP